MRKNNSGTNGVPGKKKGLWAAVLVIIAGVSVWTVAKQSESFSFDTFISLVGDSNKMWFAAAVLAMLGFIFFEGLGILTSLKAVGQKKGLLDGCFYSGSDIYFSAITPSATGGQPACAYFMMKDGIAGTDTTISLLTNLTMYTLSIVAIGTVSFITHFDIFLKYDTVSKVFISVGFAVQCFLVLFFALLVKNEVLLEKIILWAIGAGAKLRLVKDPAGKTEKMRNTMKEYSASARIMKKRKKETFMVFVWNLLQRGSVIAVAMFTYLALGGNIGNAANVFAMQSFSVIGSNFVPIPGAVGITDYLMLRGFEAVTLASDPDRASLEIVSRALSFYMCVILCGISVIVKYRLQKRRNAK